MGTNTADDGENGHLIASLQPRGKAAVRTVLQRLRTRLRSLFITDWVVLAVTVAVAATVATMIAPGGGAVVVGLGVSLASGIVLTTNHHTIWRFAAGGATVVGGLCVAALFGVTAFSVLESGLWGLLIGISLLFLAISVAGACLTPVHGVSAARLGQTAVLTVLTAIGVVTVLLVRILPEGTLRAEARTAAVAVVGDGIGAFLSPQRALAIGLVSALIVSACYSVRWAVGTVRIERYFPADRRASAIVVQRTIRITTSRIGKAALLLLITHIMLRIVRTAAGSEVPPQIATLIALSDAATFVATLPNPAASVAGWLLFAPVVRIGLAAVVIGSLGITIGQIAVQKLFGRVGFTLIRGLVPVGSGILLGVGIGTLVGDATLSEQLAAGLPGSMPSAVVEFVSGLPLFAVAQILLLLAIGLYLCLLIGLMLLRSVAGLPNRTGGPALASLGLCVAAVCAVVIGRFTIGVLTIAAGLAVWDIGEYGVTLREDLPPETSTVRPEAFHTIGSVVLAGSAAITAAIAEQYLFPAVTTSSQTAAVIGVVVLGVVGTIIVLVTG